MSKKLMVSLGLTLLVMVAAVLIALLVSHATDGKNDGGAQDTGVTGPSSSDIVVSDSGFEEGVWAGSYALSGNDAQVMTIADNGDGTLILNITAGAGGLSNVLAEMTINGREAMWGDGAGCDLRLTLIGSNVRITETLTGIPANPYCGEGATMSGVYCKTAE